MKTKKNIHAELLETIIKWFDIYNKEYDIKILDYELNHYEKRRANVWIAEENKEGKRSLDLLTFSYGELSNCPGEFAWCINDISEGEGPIDVTCPLRLLELTPQENNPCYSEDWREMVIRFWETGEDYFSQLKYYVAVD